MSPKDKTQLEERLRRVAGPSSPGKPEPQTPVQPAQISRLAAGGARPDSPSRLTTPRPGSPAISGISRIAKPGSPPRTVRSASPAPSQMGRPSSPMRPKLPGQIGIAIPSTTTVSLGLAAPTSPSGLRPKSFLPSRLGPPKPRPNFAGPPLKVASRQEEPSELPYVNNASGRTDTSPPSMPSTDSGETLVDAGTYDDAPVFGAPDDITITISSILSSDPSRSVDALKKIQRILVTKPEDGHTSAEYRELAEHTDGLIETITLQMAHVFERPDDLVSDENFRLAKHLIQTLNTFCDHIFLAESLTVDILNPLLEELTLRLLETDESHITKVKDLSRFINMIILRLFATGRRMSIFRCVSLAFVIFMPDIRP